MRHINLTGDTRARAALPLIAAASILPRLTHLTGSLWNDETFSTQLRLGFHRDTLAWMAYDTHPPLYNLVMLLWVSLFGDSAVAIRALPLLCSAASVFWIGRVAGLLFGPGAGLGAAVLLALSGGSVFYAQEARSYSLIMLLFLLMAESLLLHHRRGDQGSLRRFLAFSSLCAMSHVYAFLFVLCLWTLLLLAARTSAAAVGIGRAALAQAAVVAPCYFLIALMILFTREHQYLWGGLTYPFGPRDAAALLAFYLFGYGRLNAVGAAQVVAAALFLAGVVVAIRSAPRVPAPPAASAFASHGLGRLVGALAGLGLLGSLAAALAPWWLPVDALQRLVGRDKHADLMAALPQLLQRTGLLYLSGYAALLAAWVALGHPERPRWAGRAFGRLARRRGPWLDVDDVVVGLPVMAIAVVMVANAFRPTFNNRYMLALLPLGLLAVTAALWAPRRSWARVALLGAVAGAQAFSLTGQDDAYALLKPDYRGALAYVSRLGRPATGTAVWELDNLSRYYAGRREIAPVTVLPRPEAMALDSLVVFVPRAYPLEAPHLADLREMVHARATTSRSFAGLTLYEVGPHTPARTRSGP